MRISKFLSLLLAVGLVCSCGLDSAETVTPGEGEGVLTIGIDNGVDGTRASDATAQTYESQLNNIYLFIFDSSNKIYRYEALGTTTSKSYSVTVGTYTVAVAANVPASISGTFSAVTTLAQLKAKASALGDNSKTASAGFTMFETKSATVTTSGASVSIPVKRFASRVKLVSVTTSSDCAGTVVVQGAFLENVIADTDYDGTAGTTWNNLAGRKSGTVITSSTADNASLTYYSGSSFPQYFYGYYNNTTTDQFGSSATAGKTRIVVQATYNGTVCYYPVTLDAFGRNCTYDVKLTISGVGSSDPNTLVSKGNLSATITVAAWDGSAEALDVTI